MIFNVLKFTIIVLVAMTGLHAFGPGSHKQEQIFIDSNGLPLVMVKLTSKNSVTKEFKFILDTGASVTVLDTSISDIFYTKEKNVESNMADSMSSPITTEPVIVNRIDVGGFIRDGIPAVRMDLKNSIIGKCQDRPLDGIIGMTYLKGARFKLDFKNSNIVWFDVPDSTYEFIPIHIGNDGRPYVNVQLNGEKIKCLIDTGHGSAVSMPEKMLKSTPGATAITGSFATELKRDGVSGGREQIIIGSNRYLTNVDYTEDGDVGLLGADVWRELCPIVDLAWGRLFIKSNGKHVVELQRHTRLPIIWEDVGGERKLVIVIVKTNSILEKVGCMPGDIVVGVNDVHEDLLRRDLLIDMLANKSARMLRVIRKGVLHSMDVSSAYQQ